MANERSPMKKKYLLMHMSCEEIYGAQYAIYEFKNLPNLTFTRFAKYDFSENFVCEK